MTVAHGIAPQGAGAAPSTMGYHRPVSQFNRGKQSEHRERRHFVERPSCAHSPIAAPTLSRAA